jgi:hypothetical protein
MWLMLRQFIRRLKYRWLSNSPSVWIAKSFMARRILSSPPIAVPKSADFDLHVLACSKDFFCLLWALRSFYHFSGRAASLAVHDDGSLGSWHVETLARLFPGLRTISKCESDRELDRHLASLPNCQRLRRRSCFSIKIFDFPYYANADRLILLDSDVLFFEKPADLLASTDASLFNSDIWTNYLYSIAEIETRFGVTVPEKVNVGLGAMSKNLFDFSFIERILSDDRLQADPFFIDQTIIAILASRRSIRLLGLEYLVSLSRGLSDVTTKHYTRLVRHLFFLEGLPRLIESGVLR